jgi:hypothetical protein
MGSKLGGKALAALSKLKKKRRNLIHKGAPLSDLEKIEKKIEAEREKVALEREVSQNDTEVDLEENSSTDLPEVEETESKVERMTWNEFRAEHKGKTLKEISVLWAEYKDSN